MGIERQIRLPTILEMYFTSFQDFVKIEILKVMV